MKVIFLGTNGWYDTETGNTICTLLRTERFDILLDAGNGIHRASDHLDGSKPVYLFLSHFHLDHIAGLHILAKFRLHAGLTVCAPTGGGELLKRFIDTPFTVPLASLPYPARILEMPAALGSLPFAVEALPLRHTSFTLGYRIALDGRAIGYCPDTGYCEHAVALGKGTDLLVTECAYKEGQTREDWPHLNPETAARIALEAGARRLVLTHFDAGVYGSHAERKQAEAVAAALFPGTVAATDGLAIDL